MNYAPSLKCAKCVVLVFKFLFFFCLQIVTHAYLNNVCPSLGNSDSPKHLLCKYKEFCHLFNKLFSVVEENSCSSSDAVWVNREQSVQTPVMMHSPHLTSTVLRDPKKMRPEDSYTAAYTMPTEQHSHQPVPPQQQPHHHHQATIDYKYKKPFYILIPLQQLVLLLLNYGNDEVMLNTEHSPTVRRLPGC